MTCIFSSSVQNMPSPAIRTSILNTSKKITTQGTVKNTITPHGIMQGQSDRINGNRILPLKIFIKIPVPAGAERTIFNNFNQPGGNKISAEKDVDAGKPLLHGRLTV